MLKGWRVQQDLAGETIHPMRRELFGDLRGLGKYRVPSCSVVMVFSNGQEQIVSNLFRGGLLFKAHRLLYNAA